MWRSVLGLLLLAFTWPTGAKERQAFARGKQRGFRAPKGLRQAERDR